MIHELRTYTLPPGRAAAFLDATATIGLPIRGGAFGTNHGYWVAEIGALNQVWHLWSYASLDERARLRGELARNERWANEFLPAIRPLILRQEVRLLNPLLPLAPPDGAGHFYEFRIYRARFGDARAWAELLRSYLPVRERYSPIVGLWTEESPQPNAVVHLWAYPDLNSRMKVRADAMTDPGWREFLRKGGAMLEEMHSTLLLSAAFSPMK